MNPFHTEEAPRPVGPYSQAVRVDKFLFLSGQIGIDPSTGKLKESFEEQVRQSFKNVEAVLRSAGLEKDSIFRVVVYLTDLSLFKEFNRLYEEFFRDVPVKPVRTTVGVKELPLGALLELEVTAVFE